MFSHAVLVTGGRNYDERDVVFWALDTQQPTVVIHGCASGADSLAAEWCKLHPNVAELKFPADWNKYGKAAGPIRNKQMLDVGQPDVVLAFPGGAGTANMMRQARERGVAVQTASRGIMTSVDGKVES